MMKQISLVLLCGLLVFTQLGCSRSSQMVTTGAVLGTGIGMLTGSTGTGAVIGTGIGLLAAVIINDWTIADKQQASVALEKQPSGQSSAWVNPDTQTGYTLVPEPAYTQQGRVYRDFFVEATDANGNTEHIKARAWRDSNGTWTFE